MLSESTNMTVTNADIMVIDGHMDRDRVKYVSSNQSRFFTFHLKTEPDNINIMGNGCNPVLKLVKCNATEHNKISHNGF